MADFGEHKERCLQIIRPHIFSKSIAHCIAEYQMDQVDFAWDLSEWIRLSLNWIEQHNKQKDKPAGITDFKQIWLPVQRRTDLGPLRPIWPWNFTGIFLRRNKCNLLFNRTFHFAKQPTVSRKALGVKN